MTDDDGEDFKQLANLPRKFEQRIGAQVRLAQSLTKSIDSGQSLIKFLFFMKTRSTRREQAAAGPRTRFRGWLEIIENRNAFSAAKITHFLEFAEKERLNQSSDSMPGGQERAIKAMSKALNVALTCSEGGRKRLTPEGIELASLLGQFADFATRCITGRHRWCIGAQDSVLQWILMPNLESVRTEVQEAVNLGRPAEQHQRVVFEVRDVRSRDFGDELRTNSIHIAVVRRGFLKAAEISVVLSDVLSPHAQVPKEKKRFFAWSVGAFTYTLAVPRELKRQLLEKARKHSDDPWVWAKLLPLVLVRNHEIAFREGHSWPTLRLEDIAAEHGLDAGIFVESPAQAIQALRARDCGVILPHFARIVLPFQDFEYEQPPFLNELPAQELFLVCKSGFIRENRRGKQVLKALHDLLVEQLQFAPQQAELDESSSRKITPASDAGTNKLA